MLRLADRGGKSAAVNLGLSSCTGDIVVISDIDTTFDRSAFAEMISEFLAVAERSGLIVKLGNWVLRSACRQAEQWLAGGVALPPVAVNVSALQFKASRELENEIEAALAETGLSAGSLEIEITETALMGSSSGHDNVVERLRARGLRIAIDDFGTGYSSLLYLRRFPVDRIKVAQEFVKDIGIEPNDTAIVKAAISLARELGCSPASAGMASQSETTNSVSINPKRGFMNSSERPRVCLRGILN